MCVCVCIYICINTSQLQAFCAYKWLSHRSSNLTCKVGRIDIHFAVLYISPLRFRDFLWVTLNGWLLQNSSLCLLTPNPLLTLTCQVLPLLLEACQTGNIKTCKWPPTVGKNNAYVCIHVCEMYIPMCMIFSLFCCINKFLQGFNMWRHS